MRFFHLAVSIVFVLVSQSLSAKETLKLDKYPWRIHATNKADWSKSFKASNAIDGDKKSYWYQHGLKNGHRRVAIFWSGIHASQFEIERHRVFTATIEANGGEIISCEDNSFIDESNGKGQIPNVRKIIHSVEKLQKLEHVPSAIFATVDIISAGLYYVLPHLNLVPGRDIEIIGCNNDEPYINPLYEENLVTIDIHPELVGKRAVEQLFWRIDNPKEAINVVEIEVEVINKNKQIKKEMKNENSFKKRCK